MTEKSIKTTERSFVANLPRPLQIGGIAAIVLIVLILMWTLLGGKPSLDDRVDEQIDNMFRWAVDEGDAEDKEDVRRGLRRLSRGFSDEKLSDTMSIMVRGWFENYERGNLWAITAAEKYGTDIWWNSNYEDEYEQEDHKFYSAVWSGMNIRLCQFTREDWEYPYSSPSTYELWKLQH